VNVSTDKVLVLDKVSRTFRGFRRRAVEAVRELSLEVRRGEIFGLLGPNGSGKTTTIQMVLGLLAPTSGRVSLFGGSPRAKSARRRVGYLPEEFAGHEFLSGEETLLYYGGFFGLSRAELHRRAEDLLRILDLWEDRRRRLREYSKGMRRRIGLAQSLLHDPELIVLDEPTNGLDPVGIRKVKKILTDLTARGRSVLVSSHILPEMEDLCDRVAILSQGTSLITGPLTELLSRGDRLRIVVRGAVSSAQEVQELLSANGLRVEAVEPDRRTLENLFMEVVDGPGSPAPPAAGPQPPAD
jgi:ABC-2 type transport system ATP-binding protein